MNAKKILLLMALPVFVFVLSGCGQKTVPQTTPTAQTVEPKIQPDQKQQSEPPRPPSNPVQAIDSETKSLDQEIDSATEEIDSAELSDAQFGL